MRVLKPLRRRLTAGMELANSPRYESSLASPGSPAQAVLMEHELVSTQEVRKEVMAQKRASDARSDAQAGGKRAKRGTCCMVGKGLHGGGVRGDHPQVLPVRQQGRDLLSCILFRALAQVLPALVTVPRCPYGADRLCAGGQGRGLRSTRKVVGLATFPRNLYHPP